MPTEGDGRSMMDCLIRCTLCIPRGSLCCLWTYQSLAHRPWSDGKRTLQNLLSVDVVLSLLAPFRVFLLLDVAYSRFG